MKRFNSTPAGAPDPITIEQVFAEKPGGGIVVDPGFDCPASTAVSVNEQGKFEVIKAVRLVAKNNAEDTTIKVAKGSGIKTNDVLGHGKKAVKVTSVSKTNSDYDVLTLTFGVAIDEGTVLYQAKAESADAAEAYAQPKYVLGNKLYGGLGDQPIRLVNGANLRKETANIADEVAALLPTINLV